MVFYIWYYCMYCVHVIFVSIYMTVYATQSTSEV